MTLIQRNVLASSKALFQRYLIVQIRFTDQIVEIKAANGIVIN